jgi:hypothetical protein
MLILQVQESQNEIYLSHQLHYQKAEGVQCPSDAICKTVVQHMPCLALMRRAAPGSCLPDFLLHCECFKASEPATHIAT